MPLYGAAQGVQSAIGDAQQLSQISLFPVEAQLARARAGLATEQLREKQGEVSALKKFSQPGTTAGQPQETMSQRLSRLANLEFQAGAPTAGMALLKQADMMQMHESTVQKNNSTIQLNGLKQNQLEAQWAAQRLAAIDPKSPSAPAQWHQVQTDYMTMFGKPSPFSATPYSPQLLDQVLHGSLSAKDQLTLKIRERELGDREQQMQNTVQYQGNRIKATNARTKAIQDHDKFLEKQGGKPAVANTTDVRNAGQLIKQNFPGADLTSPDVYGASVDLANRARELMQRNRGLTYRQAQVRAMTDLEKDQNWSSSTSFGAPGPLTVTTGETPQTAMPLPADQSNLKTGKWYSTSQGVGKWNGKSFEGQ